MKRLIAMAVIWMPAANAGCSVTPSTEADAPFEVIGVTGSDGVPLGSVAFRHSCDRSADRSLTQGLALLHHMTYSQAEASFQEAIEADPECALGYWGVAMTYVHPLWPDTITLTNLTRGQALLEQAMVTDHHTDREQAYVDAAAAYYQDGAEAAEPARLAAFLEGWSAVHESFPEDPEATLFYVLAELAAAPASDRTYATQEAAGALAESIGARIPDHPGVLHYTIHAHDFPPLAARALPTARAYGEVAPENSHALHMTSHIYTRLGMWPESITYNVRAADVARERTLDGDVSMHYFHALDYLAYAYLQVADEAAARAVQDELGALQEPFQNHAATAYTLAAVPVRLALERHRWAEAANIEETLPAALAWEQYPHLQALPHFARALGAARTGDVAAARAAIDSLAELRDTAAALNIAYDWGTQVEVQRMTAEAWMEFEAGTREGGLALMQQAAELEASTNKNPVTPGEVLPAGELYADMLFALERYDEAGQQYEVALRRSPNRLNSLFGAGRSAELRGDSETATRYYERLVAFATAPNGDWPSLDTARAFLAAASDTST